VIDTAGTLSGKGPNSMGTTAADVKDLGFGGLKENSGSTDVAAPSGTTGKADPGGMATTVIPMDTSTMPVGEGTVEGGNRWGM
jgi:hypothetical protein